MGFLLVIPAVATGILFVQLWLFDRLAHPLVVGISWLIGICLQFAVGEPFNLVWLAGLLINVATGIYLGVLAKLP